MCPVWVTQPCAPGGGGGWGGGGDLSLWKNTTATVESKRECRYLLGVHLGMVGAVNLPIFALCGLNTFLKEMAWLFGSEKRVRKLPAWLAFYHETNVWSAGRFRRLPNGTGEGTVTPLRVPRSRVGPPGSVPFSPSSVRCWFSGLSPVFGFECGRCGFRGDWEPGNSLSCFTVRLCRPR